MFGENKIEFLLLIVDLGDDKQGEFVFLEKKAATLIKSGTECDISRSQRRLGCCRRVCYRSLTYSPEPNRKPRADRRIQDTVPNGVI